MCTLMMMTKTKAGRPTPARGQTPTEGVILTNPRRSGDDKRVSAPAPTLTQGKVVVHLIAPGPPQAQGQMSKS